MSRFVDSFIMVWLSYFSKFSHHLWDSRSRESLQCFFIKWSLIRSLLWKSWRFGFCGYFLLLCVFLQIQLVRLFNSSEKRNYRWNIRLHQFANISVKSRQNFNSIHAIQYFENGKIGLLFWIVFLCNLEKNIFFDSLSFRIEENDVHDTSQPDIYRKMR
jgi:hypothetical protein